MDHPEPLRRSAEEAAEDDYWDRWYGAWEPMDPAGVSELFAEFDRAWWFVGGWSIEALTGVRREHLDVDVSVLACDVPALRAHVAGRWQLWQVSEQGLRPLTDRRPDIDAPDSQLWVRKDPGSPWVVDLPLTPDQDGCWTNKRLPDDVRLVEEATWLAPDGRRYLRPEITLLFKSRLDRVRDRRDLATAWPLLERRQRDWLRDAVRRLHPDHPWLQQMSSPA